MNKKNRFILFLPIIIFSALLISCPALAATPSTDMDSRLVEKAFSQGLTRCYKNGRMTEKFDSLASLSSLESLTKNGGKEYVYLPTGSTNIADDNLNCRDLFTGGNWNWLLHKGGTFSGIFNYSNDFIYQFGGVQNNAQVTNYFDGLTTDEKKDFLEKMGYDVELKTSSNDNKKCFRIKYHISATATQRGFNNIDEDAYVGNFCIDEENKFSQDNTSSYKDAFYTRVGDDGKSLTITLDPYDPISELNSRVGLYRGLTISFKSDFGRFCAYSSDDTGKNINNAEECIGSWQVLSSTILSSMIANKMIGTSSSIQITGGYTNEGYDKGATISNVSVEDVGEVSDVDYTASLKSLDPYVATNSLFGYTHSNIGYTEAEKLAVYSAYLKDVYGLTVGCTGANKNVGGVKSIKYYDAGEIKTCYVDLNAASSENKAKKVRGIDSNGWLEETANLSIEDVATALGKIELTTEDLTDEDKSILEDEETNQDDKNTENTIEDACWNADLDSMAWILCPVEGSLVKTASGLNGAVGNIVENWLQISDDTYGPDSATHAVWEVMRNFANIAMIIVLFVVILSQLTGIGIDNYGIKKLLPKLIAVAILINLSFIICELAVDLSNILGAGLRDLFTNIGYQIWSDEKTVTDIINLGLGDLVTGLITAIAGGGMLATTGIAIATAVFSGSGIFIVFMIIAILLPVIASIIVFFLSLGARILIVIGCIAVSPLAFACYVFPNTKKLFTKWWKLLESALVIFPICGALNGAGYLLRVMVLINGDVQFWALIVAILVPYLVFFLIPTLLGKTISGLGAIGSAFNSMNGALKKGFSSASQALQETKSFQAAALEGKKKMNSKISGKISQKLQDIEKKQKGKLNDQEKRRLKELQDRERSGGVLSAVDRSDLSRLLRKSTRRLSRALTGALGMRNKMAVDLSGQVAAIDRYAKEDPKRVAEDAYRTAYTSTGTAINEKGGQSDTIKAVEAQYGKGAAEKSRLNVANAYFGQVAGVANGNRAIRQFQIESASREVLGKNLNNKELNVVANAAARGWLGTITTANGYSEAQVQLANELKKNEMVFKANNPSEIALKQKQVMNAIQGDANLTTLAAHVIGNDDVIEKTINESEALSTIGITDDIVKQSLETGNINALNQLEINTAMSSADGFRTSYSNANALVSRRGETARVKEYTEEFSPAPRGDLNTMLQSEVLKADGDPMRVRALMETIVSKGGSEDLMSTIFNSNISDPAVQAVIDQQMATMPDLPAKLYGKEKANGGTTKTFNKWMLEDFQRILKDKNNEKILNDASKDTLKFIHKVLSNGNDDLVSPEQVANVVYVAKGDAYTAALDLVGDMKTAPDKLQQLVGTFSDGQWSNMPMTTIHAIVGGAENVNSIVDPNVKEILVKVGDRIRQDSRLKNYLTQDARKFFNIGP